MSSATERDGVPLMAVGNGLEGEKQRETIMSYPILRTDRGTVVDYRWGVWEKQALYRPAGEIRQLRGLKSS